MDDAEVLVLLVSVALAGLYLFTWYWTVLSSWPPERGRSGKVVLGVLPVCALVIFIFTLTTLASFDVVGSSVYIFFYVVLGFAWMYLGVCLITIFFDVSWEDDILNSNNQSALFTFTGGFLGVAVIYSAANIGDGPGWWCVIFAGGLGTFAWVLFALLLNGAANVFERVTIDRDISCGVRSGCFLLASGILLGRASAGDWTSASMTVIEFLDGWPVLPLAAMAIAVERYYIGAVKRERSDSLPGSIFAGVFFVLFAVACVVLLPPLPVNPAYG